jgi:glucose/arabinose dehydrogenase
VRAFLARRAGRWRLLALALVLLLATAVVYLRRFRAPATRLSDIRLPPGFTIGLYARVPGARSLALGDSGTVFVGSRAEGAVYAVVDRNRDGAADEVLTIGRGLRTPNGVAFRDGALYVAETPRVLRYEGIESRVRDPAPPLVVTADLPDEDHHGWRYIRFGPDGLLYIGSGAPCNVCESADEHVATILRMRPDGAGLEVFARGVRNTVGFDWHPETRELWFTDNGRDWLGEDRPPDELNRAPAPGMHFGFPYCHGKGIPDPELGAKRRCVPPESTPPEYELGPHVAALGMRFYTGAMFPATYRSQIFIAEHGSWNRVHPIGYRITLVRLERTRPVSYETFAEGWLSGGRASGRPVDLLIMPDGAMLVSDDRAGAVYRIAYAEPHR